MSFRDMVQSDLEKVFFNLDEFAERRTIRWDGKTYRDVPCLLIQAKQTDRPAPSGDHAEGVYLVTAVLHLMEGALDSLPEKGRRIHVSDETGFLRDYRVASCGTAMGKARVELEGYDE